MKDRLREEPGCVTTYTKCLRYDGPDIPCIGVKKGDIMNYVVSAIVTKICSTNNGVDLSTVTVQCLLDNFTGLQEPLSKTVSSYLQLLISNQCNIKELIDAIEVRIDNLDIDNTVTLDLKCLSLTDNQGNTTYTVESVLQTLITEVCSHRLSISTINGTLVSLQAQITAIGNTVYVEPQVTSCAYSGTKPLSQGFLSLSSDYCTYKGRVGSVSAISTAIARQPASLNTQFAADANFVQQVTTLADSENNQWLVIQKLMNDIQALQDCACKVDCSSIKIGWQVNDNQDGDGVTLDFSGDYGNVIPSVFTDCGSTVTFVDTDKKQKTYVLKLKQEYTSVEFDLSMLNLSAPIMVKVCAQLCNGTQQCCKCEEAQHMVVNGTCDACAVTISGSSGSVTIKYMNSGNTTTIKAVVGEVVYIPKTAINVTYVTNSGNAIPDTTCLTITQQTLTCYEFKWESEIQEGGDNHDPLRDAYFTGVLLDGTKYNFTPSGSDVHFSRGGQEIGLIINGTSGLNTRMTALCSLDGPVSSNMSLHRLRISVPADAGIPELLVNNPTVGNYGNFKLTIPAVATDNCSCDGLTTIPNSSPDS